MELQVSTIENKIYEIRGRRVMLDFDLAEIYEVSTKALKQAVRRNIARFPDDFMFELTQTEFRELVTNCDHMLKHSYIAPFAFLEHGVAMLSSVLRSEKAIQANINIVRAFVAVREYLLTRASESVEIAHLQRRVFLLEQANDQLKRSTDDNTEAINENIKATSDLSEDIGKELETIYAAISALAAKAPKLDKNRIMIGYKRGDDKQ